MADHQDARLLVWSELEAQERAGLLRRTESDLSPYLEKAAAIIEAVRREGDAALCRFAAELDGADPPPEQLRVDEAEFARAHAAAGEELRSALAFAAESIRRFHEAQRPEPLELQELRPGVFVGERCLPLDSLACYVPRGKGAFPSVFLMTTLPAKVAGVARIAVLTPPGPDGKADPATLAAAHEVGGVELYLAGGAQAVAAAAFGTETIPACPRILGPGSPWVAAARRLLADRIEGGVPAGPSEAVVLADGTVSGRLAALDLLVEAEHGPDSSAWLVTPDRVCAEEALAALPELLTGMAPERAAFARSVLSGPAGGILLVPDMEEACRFVNDYAPEHLLILAEDPFRWLPEIRHAGEVLLGRHAPIPLGNFVLGPNAVLPTAGRARTASPLSVHDCMKRSGVGYVTEEGYRALAPKAEHLALYEGFSAHARAVSSLREEAA